MGVAAAGFHPELVVEWNELACATLEANRNAGLDPISRWKIENKDVRLVNYTAFGTVDLVSGGPPCQPFSIGGKHKGPADHRDMWLEAIRAVRELSPRAFLFENVQGLLRPAFADYLTYVCTHLEWPELSSRDDESWPNHLARLKSYASGRREKPRYHVRVMRVNAADYGTPQWRNRVIIAGVRTDIVDDWSLPSPTHSLDRLLWDQWVTGEYWKRHEFNDRTRPEPNARVKAMIARIEKRKEQPAALPWVTVRDAIGELPSPVADREVFPAHLLWPGARAYRKHTGSSWDMPSKALKAGAHGVPGGENMLALDGSSVRYFTIREMARLQGFPDRYILPGKWASSMRQLGNAVPVQLATAMAGRLAEVLNGAVRERAAA